MFIGIGMGVGLGGGSTPLVYLLRDQFTTPDDAPISSPRVSGLIITDTGNKLSVSDGVMMKTGGTFKVVSPAYPRAIGLAFYVRGKITTTNGAAVFGISEDGTNITDGVTPVVGTLISAYDDTTAIYWVGDRTNYINAVHDYLVIARSAGALVYVRGGRFGKWYLMFESYRSDGANLQWLYKNTNATDSGILDDAIVTQLTGVYASDFGLASYHSASPVSPTSCTASRSAMVDFTWTPGMGETMEIYARQVDTSNRMILRCNQAAGTFALFRVTAGIETSMQSVAQTWTVGTPYKIMLMASPNHTWQAYINQTIKLAPGVSLVNEFGTGFGVSGFATGSNFAVYPLNTTALPAPFDFAGFRWILGYGDSKTYGGNYQAYLCDKLEVSTGSRWCFDSIGRSGYTVATMAATIVQDLALQTQEPEYILFNLGANDVASLPSEATWKANATTIFSAMHTKWPNAQIYIARPWVRGEATDCNTLATWINDLVTLNPTYLHLGTDERVFLENGDDGVTYTVEGLHPNDAGYDLTATNWKAVIGL